MINVELYHRERFGKLKFPALSPHQRERERVFVASGTIISSVKVPMNFFIILFERAFKMMKNGVYFIVIALLVAECFKILIYAN